MDDAPAMPSGDGHDPPLVLTCRDCAWRRSSNQYGRVFAEAVEHAHVTGHTLLYKGEPQNLLKFTTGKKAAVA